jgi:hypothetical protein
MLPSDCAVFSRDMPSTSRRASARLRATTSSTVSSTPSKVELPVAKTDAAPGVARREHAHLRRARARLEDRAIVRPRGGVSARPTMGARSASRTFRRVAWHATRCADGGRRPKGRREARHVGPAQVRQAALHEWAPSPPAAPRQGVVPGRTEPGVAGFPTQVDPHDPAGEHREGPGTRCGRHPCRRDEMRRRPRARGSCRAPGTGCGRSWIETAGGSSATTVVAYAARERASRALPRRQLAGSAWRGDRARVPRAARSPATRRPGARDRRARERAPRGARDGLLRIERLSASCGTYWYWAGASAALFGNVVPALAVEAPFRSSAPRARARPRERRLSRPGPTDERHDPPMIRGRRPGRPSRSGLASTAPPGTWNDWSRPRRRRSVRSRQHHLRHGTAGEPAPSNRRRRPRCVHRVRGG